MKYKFGNHFMCTKPYGYIQIGDVITILELVSSLGEPAYTFGLNQIKTHIYECNLDDYFVQITQDEYNIKDILE